MIAKHAQNKILTNDGLSVLEEAKTAKKANPSVVNAIIGTLYDDEGKFYKFNTIDKTIKELSDESFYTYSTSDGGKEFREKSLDFVFGSSKESVLKGLNYCTIATPGGTGAISTSLYNSLNEGETLILPNVYWGPYKNMADSDMLEVINYEFIKDGFFNFEGFKKSCNESINRQNKIVTILNDPCNNPTGYSLSLIELDLLIKYLNNTKADVTLIYDIAYFDYSVEEYDIIRKRFELFNQINDNITINICFSLSKSFAIYGMRIGGLITLNKNKQFINDIYASSCFLARTRWSNTSKAGINILIKIMSDNLLYTEYLKELNQARHILKRRALLFVKEANQIGLETYPYGGGFFVTVKCINSKKAVDCLRKNQVYLLEFNNSIRIAICSLPYNEIAGLAKIIKNVIDNI